MPKTPSPQRTDPLKIAHTLRHRLRAMAWWRGLMQAYPGGVVTVPMAARILGVQRSRVRSLIREGRLPAIKGYPDGTTKILCVPVDALLGAPTALESGRKLTRRSVLGTQMEVRPMPYRWEPGRPVVQQVPVSDVDNSKIFDWEADHPPATS